MRLIPLLAALGLALAPVTAPAAAAAAGMRVPSPVAEAGVTQGDHPCPGEMGAIALEDGASSDCPEGCLVVTFGLSGTISVLQTTLLNPELSVTGLHRPRSEAVAFASLHGAPLTEPPRA